MKYVGDKIHYLSKEPREKFFRLRIPAYHRAAVGLMPGTKMFLVPISSSRELIVTPVRPKKWGDLWKIEVDLVDEPGGPQYHGHPGEVQSEHPRARRSI
jgi:hypothetical protein